MSFSRGFEKKAGIASSIASKVVGGAAKLLTVNNALNAYQGVADTKKYIGQANQAAQRGAQIA